MKVERLGDIDVEQTIRLFCEIVDELHVKMPDIERLQYKGVYPVDEVKNRLQDPGCVYLVGKSGNRVICFLFSWVTEGVGNIYWLGVDKEYRMKKYGAEMVRRVIDEFENRQCYEARVFTFQRVGLRLFENCGFKDITFIDKHLFGVNLVQMVRKLDAFRDVAYEKRIIISGDAGQGIKLIAHSLGSILSKLGKEVSVNLTYDSRVMGGNIKAELIYSNKKIESPFFDEADIAILLSKSCDTSIRAKKMIVEESIEGIDPADGGGLPTENGRVPFQRIAMQQFHSHIFVNMLAMGRLLRLIGIEIGQVNFQAEFPARFLDENIKAVKYGYSFRDWI